MCSTCNHHQKVFMELSYPLKIQVYLMAYLNEGVYLQKAAQVRLENLSQIRNQSTFINNSQRIGCLRDMIEMMKSLYIENCNRRETKNKKEEERNKL